MTEQEQKDIQSLYEQIQSITKRGNAVEIQRTKEGYKILEINRKLVKAVTANKN